MATHAEAPRGPIDTPAAHTDAYMDMRARRGMSDGFGRIVTWGCMLILTVVGYAVFTLCMHIPWIGALIGFAVFAFLGGLVLNMGGAWMATVAGLFVMGLVVQGLIALGAMLLPH